MAYNHQFYFVLCLSLFFMWLAMRLNDRAFRRVKLSDLRLFQAVMEHGGMAKAAAQLNMSQPAVSKAIAALEHVLGVRLLDRKPQGVEPTVYGRALAKGGVAVFDELKQSIRQIEFLTDPTAGELRVGATEAGAAGFVAAVIARLSGEYSRVTFHVVTADPATLASRHLPQRNVELAIGALPARDPEIQQEVLFDDRHFVMAGPKNKWVGRRNIALADLVSEPWVLPPPDSIQGVHIGEAFRANGLKPPDSQVVSFSIPLCHHLLATGRFLTMHPVVMASLGKHLPLKVLDVRFPGIPRPVGIMTLKNRTLGPLAMLFIARAREMAKPLTKAGKPRR
jgi:DNA-binding transcriptional LysR family regulator